MLNYHITIPKERFLEDKTLTIRDTIEFYITNLIEQSLLDGILINIKKIEPIVKDYDNHIHYDIYYTEKIDENYLLEKERLEIGL